jgi:tol-pal system-associated acyl-CoA thioesterase
MSGNTAATIRDGRHHYVVRVYYEDTDAGVVYHANYLRFAERARTEALRDLDVPHAEMTAQHGVMFIVRRAKLDYLAPARTDDSLVVVTQLLHLRAALVELRQTFFLAAEPGDCLPWWTCSWPACGPSICGLNVCRRAGATL